MYFSISEQGNGKGKGSKFCKCNQYIMDVWMFFKVPCPYLFCHILYKKKGGSE